MTTSVDNVAFDMNTITPNKRKRDALGGKENQIYGHNGYMEVKSLADLMPAKGSNNNAFEVARKPPKKKTKLDHAPVEPKCFDNAALNLNGPDHVVNPFEIKRAPPLDAGREPKRLNCFVNTALNIRGPEKEVRNPFEIVRQNGIVSAGPAGHDNAGLREGSPHISRAIAVNFTPTIGCRINFADVPLESLTPCTMLAKKLVFSPAPPPPQPASHSFQYNAAIVATPKKPNDECELSAISEESLDIIAELDCYQLELENSINEAKIVKRAMRRSSGGNGGAGRGKNLMDLKNRKSFASMLAQAEEGTANGDEANESVTGSTVDLSTKLTPKLDATTLPNIPDTATVLNPDNSGVDYEEIDEAYEEDATEQPDSPNDDEDEFMFKNPAPFVRTFKRKSIHRPSTTAKDINTIEAPVDTATEKTEKTGIRHSIRNSIRRLIKSQPKKAASADNVNMADAEAMPAPSTVFATLRQSLRRKPRQTDMPERCEHDMSVVCDTERKVYRQQPRPAVPTRAMSTQSNEDLGVQRKPSVTTSLRSSFRNTTKDVRRQVMKSMFKKNVEEYQFD